MYLWKNKPRVFREISFLMTCYPWKASLIRLRIFYIWPWGKGCGSIFFTCAVMIKSVKVKRRAVSLHHFKICKKELSDKDQFFHFWIWARWLPLKKWCILEISHLTKIRLLQHIVCYQKWGILKKVSKKPTCIEIYSLPPQSKPNLESKLFWA